MSQIEHRHLRSALEFAVLIAAEGQKRRPPLAFPKELRQYFSKPRLPAASLGKVRRIVEGDPTFRAAISAGAVPELVDDVGRLWLAKPEGWEASAIELLAAEEAASKDVDLRQELKRSEKRRLAAEQAAVRVQTEVVARDAVIASQLAELDDLRADVAKAEDALAEMRIELIDTRNEVRHARDREAAAQAKLAGLQSQIEVAASVTEPDAERSEEIEATRVRLADALRASEELATQLREALAASAPPTASPTELVRRTPVPLPGGVISTSAEAARHLVAADASLFVDGYNVAKLGWPDRSLERQREALIAGCENLVRRHGSDVTIVFDGSSIVGAHAPRRRSVRVVYSPEGVTADDVIRREVAALPVERRCVVVTNDREIVDDVKAQGANVVPSNAFIAVL